jgi:hypothetical protein
MGLAMADPTRDTAAAMIKALRSAELFHQPLAVGLADALEELIDRESEDFGTASLVFYVCIRRDCIDLIINHLRNNNHA